MLRDNYEILLLEIRQAVREAEESLHHATCIDFQSFKKLRFLKEKLRSELIRHRMGETERSKIFISLMEG